MAFSDLWDTMTNAENFVKFVVKNVLERCETDINFIEKFVDKNIRIKLSGLVDKPFTRIPYKDAIKLLQEEIAKDPSIWQYPEVGMIIIGLV